MKLIIQSILAFSVMLIVASCKEKGEIDYIPFQTSDGGKWGLISTDGEILLESEFRNQPSVAINGFFVVRNNDGLYEIYSATKNPEQIGKKYKSVALFSEGLAPVVEPNEWIKYINQKGEVEFELKEIKGKSVKSANRFHEGLALVLYDDKTYGYINKKGNLEFDKSYYYATDFNDHGVALAVETNNIEKWCVINTSGNIIFSYDISKCIPIQFVGKNLIVADTDSKTYWIVDEKGDKVGNSFDAEEIRVVDTKRFAFKDDNGWGLRDIDKVVIRPKYDDISCNGNMIAVEGEDGWILLNSDGDRVGDKTYKKITCLCNVKRSTSSCIVKDGSKFYFADSKGVIANDAVAMSHFNPDNSIDMVTSDYFDIEAFISSLEINDEGLIGMKLNGVFGEEAVKTFSPLEPDDLYYKNEFKYESTIKRCGLDIDCFLYMSKLPIYDFLGPSECDWNEESHIVLIGIKFALNDQLEGKKDILTNAIKNSISKFAKKTDELKFESSIAKYEIISNDNMVVIVAEAIL